MMMHTPKTIGRADLERGLLDQRAPLGRAEMSPACSSRRTKFSTITTEASTMRPKSSAPRLIRFAETPNALHHQKREQQRQRDHRGRNERRADVAQEQKQNQRDERVRLRSGS